MANHPATSTPLSPVDPTLQEEFRRLMDGFALPANAASPAAQQQRDHRNAVEGARVRKVRALADLPVLLPVPTVAPKPSHVPLMTLGRVYDYEAKPLPRRFAVPPTPAVVPTATSRTARRLSLCRQLMRALFLSKNDALEECPNLLPHMVPTVVY